MIGLVLVAHGGLAEEMLRATEHVVGPLPKARAIGLAPRDDLTARRGEIEAAIADVDAGQGVVVITDLFGGTPSNLAIAAMARFANVDVVTGVNLPMMMRLATSRDLPRRVAVSRAVEAGRKYVLDVASVMSPEANAVDQDGVQAKDQRSKGAPGPTPHASQRDAGDGAGKVKATSTPPAANGSY